MDSGDSNMGHRSGVGLSQSGTGSDMDTTDGLGQGRGSNSRPGSSHQISSRPVSSRNRIGSGIGNRQGLDGKHRKGGTSTSMDVRAVNKVGVVVNCRYSEKTRWSSKEIRR